MILPPPLLIYHPQSDLMVDDKQVGVASLLSSPSSLPRSPQSRSDLNQNDWITIKRLIPSLLKAASAAA